MNTTLLVVISILVLVIAVAVSIPRAPSHTNGSQPERGMQVGSQTKREIARRIAEGNEHAHQQNHRDMCRLASEVGRMQPPVLGYGTEYPALPDGGEIVDAEVIDVPLLN